MPSCEFAAGGTSTAGAYLLVCAARSPLVEVTAAADGTIVHIVREPAMPAVTEETEGKWSWADQQMLGPHVVVDHGPYGDHHNTQTVYAGLGAIDDDLWIGARVMAGDTIGSVSGPSPEMLFSIWSDDVRQDGASVVVAFPSVEEQQAAASALGDVIGSPTDPLCPLVLGASQLPGAARPYRSGTHRGIDFGCGAADRVAYAVADGQVVYVVDDYADPSVSDRGALLANTGLAGFTPHWTLLMLYGNFVVIDHGMIEGAGRVVTISAHLEAIDPEIELGARVTKGQPLGEIGNRGTNASAAGLRGSADPSLHLHWELFIDGWYLGAGIDSPSVAGLITTAMCGAAQTSGCPG